MLINLGLWVFANLVSVYRAKNYHQLAPQSCLLEREQNMKITTWQGKIHTGREYCRDVGFVEKMYGCTDLRSQSEIFVSHDSYVCTLQVCDRCAARFVRRARGPSACIAPPVVLSPENRPAEPPRKQHHTSRGSRGTRSRCFYPDAPRGRVSRQYIKYGAHIKSTTRRCSRRTQFAR